MIEKDQIVADGTWSLQTRTPYFSLCLAVVIHSELEREQLQLS